MDNVIEIVVRTKDESSPGFASAEKSAKGFGGTLADIGKTAAGFLSANLFEGLTTKALDFFNQSTAAASDQNEALSKSQAVWGEQAATIEKWATSSAKDFGMAKTEALDLYSAFGNMFKQLGIGADRALDMSSGMQAMAADMASFHNADISDVIESQQAAFRGEYDSIQRFLPTLNAAAVQQEALAETHKKSTDELTDGEKAQATYMLMMKGMGDATGDFERTSEGAANKQRIAKAEMANMTAEIGQKLLPVQVKLTEAKLAFAKVLTEKVVPQIEKIVKWFQQHKGVALALAGVVGGILVAAFVAWGVSVISATWPIIAIGAAIAALVAGVIYAYTHWETFRNAVDAVARWLVDKLWPALQKIWDVILNDVVPVVGNVIEWLVKFQLQVFQIEAAIVRFVINAVGFFWRLAADIYGAISGVISTLWGWATSAYNVGVTIIGFLGDVVGFVASLPGKLAAAAGNLWGWLTQGLTDAANWVLEKIEGMINGIIGAFNRLPGPDISKVGLPRIGGAPGSGTARGMTNPRAGGMASGGLGGGLMWVGENGPELARLGPGSHVYGAGESARMSGQGGGAGGGPQLIQVQLVVDGRVLAEVIRPVIQKDYGGDVQAALGWSI